MEVGTEWLCHPWRPPDLRVGVLVERVEVEAQRAGEQRRVLRDDGDPVAQRVQPDCPGRKPPFWAVERPVRPYKSPM